MNSNDAPQSTTAQKVVTFKVDKDGEPQRKKKGIKKRVANKSERDKFLRKSVTINVPMSKQRLEKFREDKLS